MSSAPDKAKDIFLIAVEQHAPDKWPSYLDEVCADNPELRRRVELLLEAHEGDESLLDSPAIAPPATLDQPITEKPGTQIGPYKLLQQLGEGGMGVVYMAEQKEPVKRRVALKIIKPGMDTRQVIARFEAERQALAMMDHPNIAKVLDAGATESGRPYFVMELVNGLPVTKYCDEQHLTPKERLELFVPTCQAVQHAHQKGIIHRDLKPSNILVALYDGQPVPKVIDFGVAKATSQTLTEKTMFTQLGQVVGTLEYMSPEQAERNQLDIDTRSDIYSLGVVLYELLTGDTPFDRTRLRSAAFDEMLRIIREEEPPRPSTKLSSSQALPSIAANRHIEPARLGSMIRGELDWIVMKALEKDRGRRYETASSFAADVQHYLNDEAVVACPPSAAYKLRKFARRNKAVIGTTAAITAILIAGIIGTSWQAYRATKAEGRAWQEAERATKAEELAEEQLSIVELQKTEIEKEKQKAITAAKRADQEAENAKTEAAIAKAVNDFLNKDLLGMAGAAQQVDHKITPDPDVKLRTLLDRAAETIEKRFHDQPWIEAAIRNTLGDSYRAIGVGEEAEKQHRRAWKLRKEVFGDEHQNTLQSKNGFANSLGYQGRYEEAEKLCREILETLQQVKGSEHYDTLMCMQNVSQWLHFQGKYQDAEAMLRQTLAIRQRVLGAEHPDTLWSMTSLANCLESLARYEDAEKLHRETLAIRQRVLGTEHPDTLESMGNLANSLHGLARYEDAEKLHREAIEGEQRVLGPEHPNTLGSMNNLAGVLRSQKKYHDAEKLYRETLEIQQRVLGPEHPFTLTSMNNLSALLNGQHKYQEAEKVSRSTLALCQRVLGPELPLTLTSMSNLSISLEGQHKYQEAEEVSRSTLALRQRVLGPEHPDTLGSMINLAVLLFSQNKYQDAEKRYRETLEIQQRVLGPEHPNTLVSMNNIALMLNYQREYQDAEKLYRETLEIQQRVLGMAHPSTLASMNGLAVSLSRQGKEEEAEKLYRETLAMQKQALGPEHPYTLRSMFNLANLLDRLGQYEDAGKFFREAVETSERKPGPDHPETVKYRRKFLSFLTHHGWRLATAADPAERNPELAVAYARKAVELQPDNSNNWSNLGVAQYQTGDFDAALKTLSKADQLKEGGDLVHRMFLAMTLWQLDRQEEARSKYIEGAAWMAAHNSTGGHLRFRAEAEEMLGIDVTRREELIADYFSNPSPENTTAHFWRLRGRWFYERREYEKSVADLKKSLQLKPDNAECFARRGAALVRLKRWDEAISDLDEAIRLSYDSSWPYIDRSEAHQNLNHLDEAVGDAKQAVQRDRKNRWAWRRLAQASETQADWEQTAAAYGKFLHDQPDDSGCWSPYSKALIASGQLAKYREFCAQLLDQFGQTKDPKIAWKLTATLLIGPCAVDDWSRAIELSQLVLDGEGAKPGQKSHVSELLCRAGQYERSLELRAEAMAESKREPHGWDCFWQALAHRGLGHIDESQKLARQAKQLADSGNLGATNNTVFELMYRELVEPNTSEPTTPRREETPITQTDVPKEKPEK